MIEPSKILPNGLDTTVYVAGPMSGYEEFNYPAFREAERHLREAGFTNVLNPITNDPDGNEPGANDWTWYMRASLRQVLDAETIVVLPGWTHSKGAWVEVDLAKSIGMEHVELEDVLRMAGSQP